MGRLRKDDHEIESFKLDIFKTTHQLMQEMDLKDISIRKIASKMNCSPGLIYHYFKDKNEIINGILLLKYQEMNHQLKQVIQKDLDPLECFEASLKTFIHGILNQGKAYMEMMSSDHEDILRHTKVLYKGVSREKPGFKMMVDQITLITGLDDSTAEHIGQIIWSATFGLLYRMHIERCDQKQQQHLIDFHVKYHMEALNHYRKVKT